MLADLSLSYAEAQAIVQSHVAAQTQALMQASSNPASSEIQIAHAALQLHQARALLSRMSPSLHGQTSVCTPVNATEIFLPTSNAALPVDRLSSACVHFVSALCHCCVHTSCLTNARGNHRPPHRRHSTYPRRRHQRLKNPSCTRHLVKVEVRAAWYSVVRACELGQELILCVFGCACMHGRQTFAAGVTCVMNDPSYRFTAANPPTCQCTACLAFVASFARYKIASTSRGASGTTTPQGQTSSRSGRTTPGGSTTPNGNRFRDAKTASALDLMLYKTAPCRRFAETGYCAYGIDCGFAHGDAELRILSQAERNDLLDMQKRDLALREAEEARKVQDKQARDAADKEKTTAAATAASAEPEKPAVWRRSSGSDKPGGASTAAQDSSAGSWRSGMRTPPTQTSGLRTPPTQLGMSKASPSLPSVSSVEYTPQVPIFDLGSARAPSTSRDPSPTIGGKGKR